jgi:hypothetical protein
MTERSVDPLLATAPRLRADLERLARARMVFFAGLPGTGKSLLLQQLAHLAHRAGRVVHLLQWDVVRPAFEGSDPARRYPVRDGVTHAVVRKAMGVWVRAALVRWEHAYAAPEHLLIGETPFVGNRFVELARRERDEAEALLARPTSRFVLPVPSPEVRAFLEAERERRAGRPLHPREREDAPPEVLRALWRHVADIGRGLGLVGAPVDDATPYDPAVYRGVYERVLRHRAVDILTVDMILPTTTRSVYDFTIARRDVVPEPGDASDLIAEVERRYPDLTALDREVERWWDA